MNVNFLLGDEQMGSACNAGHDTELLHTRGRERITGTIFYPKVEEIGK